MKILNVYPKTVCSVVELTDTQIDSVIAFINHSTVNYSSEEEPDLKVKLDYVTEVFLPLLEKIKQMSKDMSEGMV